MPQNRNKISLPDKSESYEVVRFLEENNFPISYSTFENANMMTVLANGKVRVAAGIGADTYCTK